MDESSRGKWEKTTATTRRNPITEVWITISGWESRGHHARRDGRERRRSRSGLIAPQILTWLILPRPPPPVYLSKVTSYTNEGFKTSPRRLANSSRRPLKISSPIRPFANAEEAGKKFCLIGSRGGKLNAVLSSFCVQESTQNWMVFWIWVSDSLRILERFIYFKGYFFLVTNRIVTMHFLIIFGYIESRVENLEEEFPFFFLSWLVTIWILVPGAICERAFFRLKELGWAFREFSYAIISSDARIIRCLPAVTDFVRDSGL